MSKKTLTFILILILLILGGGYYWFFVKEPAMSASSNNGNSTSGNGIFGGFGGSGQSTTGNGTAATSTGTSSAPTAIAVPALRELSATPVGGMTASTTASTTIVRWIDRGTGHIYQAYGYNTAVDTLSITTVPMIYNSYWNATANAFIFQSLTEDSDVVTTFYAVLTASPSVTVPAAATSSATTTASSNSSIVSASVPYTLTGSPLSAGTLAVAVSPTAGKTGNQVFTLATDGNGGAAGYISNFDGSKKVQIFDTPLTQVNVQWPTANTITITTKAAAAEPGFLYFVNPKTGVFTKIIGGINGLSTLVNTDGSEVLYSQTNSAGTGITTSVYNVSTGQSTSLPFGTLAEKCVWSALQTSYLYCAIPSNIAPAAYPDAWYQGTVSFNDSIWQIDTMTGDVHQLVNLTKTAGQGIDAENLQLDPNENFLYFVNKKDLSLWSFDLNAI